MRAIQTAVFELTASGTPYSTQYGDIYHAEQGGLTQARTVFLTGNHLPERWKKHDIFTIIEIGFGLGINFLATWQAWQNDANRCKKLHFISIELHPFQPEDLALLHEKYPELASLSTELLQKWPLPIEGFHRIELNQGQVVLTLIFGDVLNALPEIVAQVDAIYLDGFAPSKNPDCWSIDVFKRLHRLCKPNTTVATYTVAGEVRRALIDCGFDVQKVSTQTNDAQGPNKRHILLGHCARAPKRKPCLRHQQHAIIVGAGLAGCSTAAALAQRGWKITLIDESAHIASQASGNHIGLCHPIFSRDDNTQARLSRAGFARTQQQLLALQDAGLPVHFGAEGHFQLAKDASNAALMQEIVLSARYPSSLIQWLSRAEAKLSKQIDCEFGGWWFPSGLWINPPSLCQGYIDANITSIDLQINTHIDYIEQLNDVWRAFDANHNLIASSNILILANASDAQRLVPDAELMLSSSLRSVAKIPEQHINAAPYNISGLSYLTAAFAGWRCAGASLLSVHDETLANSKNIADLQLLLGESTLSSTSGIESRCCIRPNSQDRLPLVGAIAHLANTPKSVHQLYHIPRRTGLYACLGFGSRGLTWHAIAAEVLACELNGEPQAIEKSLLEEIDPARFALRSLRKGDRKRESSIHPNKAVQLPN